MALNDWYKGITNYIWSNSQTQYEANQEKEENDKMSKLARINRISSLLENSCYSKIQQQQICMFYSSLIEQYIKTNATKHYPSFLYQPQVYVPLICFNIPLKIQSQIQELYCELNLCIMFNEELITHMPSFYIKNPDFERFKPREKLVKIGKELKQTHKYEAVYGGVKVLLPLKSLERWQWSPQSYYKQQNILNIVRWIHKMILPDYFPFAKRKVKISKQIFSKSKELKQFIDRHVIHSQRVNDLDQIPLLSNIQSENSLLISIQSQINQLKTQICAMKEYIHTADTLNIQALYPTPRDNKSEIILSALSSLQACKDVQHQLQKQFQQSLIDFTEFKRGQQIISKLKFDELYKLNYWKSPQLLC